MKDNFDGNKLGIFVISVGNKIRNSHLLEQASEFWPDAKVELINALTPTHITRDRMKFLQGESSALLGRKVTEVEIAVTQSHRKCYKVALSNGYSKILVLEDDVKIPKKLTMSVIDLQRLDKKGNIIITLYAPKWSIWIKRKSKARAIFPPAYAAAYLINKNGLHHAIKNESIGLADWPTWSNKFKFYLTSGEQFDVVSSDSYLEIDRSKSKSEKNKILDKNNYNSQNIGLTDKFKNRVLFPLIWKLLGNKSGRSKIIKFYL